MVESSEVRKELDIPKKQKDLEKFAMLYLEQNGRNVFLAGLHLKEIHQILLNSAGIYHRK